MSRLRIFPLLLAALLLLCSGGLVRADEGIRSVQEELRKRNMFHGDIDGRETPGFLEALKRYQERKGFAPTGVVDGDTLRSMGLSAPPETPDLPNVPVLRSDRGSAPGTVRAAAGSAAFTRPTPRNTTPATRTELQKFIRSYLEACESPDVFDELAFYGDRVDYFHHGLVEREYIRGQLNAYYQQWPEREYRAGDSIRIGKSGDFATARVRISFTLRSGLGRTATGRTDNTFTLARRDDGSLEIVGHQEQRVRQNARRRSSKSRTQRLTPLDRTLRKFFNPPQKRKRR